MDEGKNLERIKAYYFFLWEYRRRSCKYYLDYSTLGFHYEEQFKNLEPLPSANKAPTIGLGLFRYVRLGLDQVLYKVKSAPEEIIGRVPKQCRHRQFIEAVPHVEHGYKSPTVGMSSESLVEKFVNGDMSFFDDTLGKVFDFCDDDDEVFFSNTKEGLSSTIVNPALWSELGETALFVMQKHIEKGIKEIMTKRIEGAYITIENLELNLARRGFPDAKKTGHQKHWGPRLAGLWLRDYVRATGATIRGAVSELEKKGHLSSLGVEEYYDSDFSFLVRRTEECIGQQAVLPFTKKKEPTKKQGS